MALTEEEKKIARAYNAGYVLSTYEPRLLDKIIKKNKDNEFVKVMDIARIHHDFNRGIPRKDITPEYKNGFHNARTLSENEPQLLDRLIAAPKMNKGYVKGLVAGKKEYEVLQNLKTIKQEQVNATKGIKRNSEEEKLYIKGFNYGYILSKDDPQLLSEVLKTEKDYSLYTSGMQDGQEEYQKELSSGRKNIKALATEKEYQKGFNEGYLLSKHEPKLAEQLAKVPAAPESERLNGIQDGRKQQLNDLYKETRPSWLKEDPFARDNDSPDRDMDKDIDFEPGRD